MPLERSTRTLIMLVIALGVTAVIFVGLVLLLSGDPVGFVRQTVLRVSLAFRQDDLNAAAGIDTSDRMFTIRPGDTARSIAANLAGAELITDAELFIDYVQAEGVDAQLAAGKYILQQTMNIRQITAELAAGGFSDIAFRILPGMRIEQIAANIDSNILFDFSGADFLTVVGRGAIVPAAFVDTVGLPPGMSLEGFMFPDTYALAVDITAEGLRDVLLNAFLTGVGDARFQQASNDDFTMYEVVTLASIVEREALHADEKPRIAGAYINRLDINMKLDADPTVQYPLGSPENWWPGITFADYQGVISSYNTYLNIGLPPGPISSPDLVSIDAVLEPESHDFYFFRADCRTDGYHDFAKTYEEHLANGC